MYSSPDQINWSDVNVNNLVKYCDVNTSGGEGGGVLTTNLQTQPFYSYSADAVYKLTYNSLMTEYQIKLFQV